MILRPITLKAACDFVARHHRHNRAPRGCRFCLAAYDAGELVGVAVVGRPVARECDDGITAEITRLCVAPDAPRNVCSFLYGAARRAWGAMGGGRVITYTLQAEGGASLRGAGWCVTAMLPGRVGAAWANRAGRLDQPVTRAAKVRWEALT